jgi:hypothetical protein
LGDNTHQYIFRSVRAKKGCGFQFDPRVQIVVTITRLRKTTHVRIPPGLFSIATTAELTLISSIFFDAVNTVSVGATVTTLRK